MPLLIVESPAKAKKIQEYLGAAWEVKACFGHIRDLPGKKDEVPAEYQGQPWGTLGIDVEHGYRPIYVERDSQDTIRGLRAAMKKAGGDVYLASDPDREGESIAWHLCQVLGLNPQQAKRVTYHEITKAAVGRAVANPRPINMSLVAAQECRRLLDRLTGYGVSPLVSRAIGGKQSAGRVQSAALMLLAQREQSRLAFASAGFWRVTAQAETEPAFKATALRLAGETLATASSFGPNGELKPDAQVKRLEKKEAQTLKERLQNARATVTSITRTPVTRRPPPPLTTSSLQQAASSKLKFSVEQTTTLAQKLYDAGKITYIRTDSPTLSDEALELAREAVRGRFGEAAVPAQPRQYATRNANAQEAHEAIRPAGYFLAPEDSGLDGDERALYELIYQRTLASQMHDAQGEKTALTLSAGDAELSASGTVLKTPGFTLLYNDQDDKEEEKLPALTEGQTVQLGEASAEEKTSNPPARYGEGKFVELMEKAGIGRPSTYASTLATLISRGYIRIQQRQIHVTPLGFVNAMYLYKQVPLMVDTRFTAQMEQDLDHVAQGELARNTYLDGVWKETFDPLIRRAETTPPRTRVPQLADGLLEVREGEVYLSANGQRAKLPDTLLLEDLNLNTAPDILNGTWKPKKGTKKATPATPKKPKPRKKA